MFDHILVPIDGSPLSALALPVAAEMARCHHGELTVLYIVPSPPLVYSAIATADSVAQTTERAQAEGQRMLEDACVSLGSPNIHLLCLEEGDSVIAQAIADVVEQWQCSLVVMGTHGRSGLKHLLLGSVAEGVMHRVSVPVLLVRAPKTTPSEPIRTEGSRQAVTARGRV